MIFIISIQFFRTYFYKYLDNGWFKNGDEALKIAKVKIIKLFVNNIWHLLELAQYY